MFYVCLIYFVLWYKFCCCCFFVAKDIPFLHCTLRMARSYEPYVLRVLVPIFLIIINSILVFRFAPGEIDFRLLYVVTNMLTIVAFFFIVSSSLPQIPYLTLIDKYMNIALFFVFMIAVLCVIILAYDLEGSDEETYLFYSLLGATVLGHVIFAIHVYICRAIEYQKMTVNRHQVDILEEQRLANQCGGQCMAGEPESKDEFLVHTYIHKMDDDRKDIDGNERHTYTGALRKQIQPPEAAGWLFNGEGHVEEVAANGGGGGIKKSIKNTAISTKHQQRKLTVTTENEQFGGNSSPRPLVE